MTTINSIEDLIRLLDENPEWLEAVRARILTRELLDMPQTLANFAQKTEDRFDAMDKSIEGIRNDMGVLKGGHARSSAIRQATAITDSLGLNRVRNLDYDELRALTISADTSDILRNDIMSFRLADLVMEATDQSGDSCYVAVEISYTANGRDTDRAIRNAGFLTSFTGHPAQAAIAGINRDRRIEGRVESGEVFWHQLDLDDLQAEWPTAATQPPSKDFTEPPPATRQ